MKHPLHIFKIKAGVEQIPQLSAELLRLLPHTPVQIDKVSVEIVEHFKIVSGRLVEQHPARAAEHFDISLVSERKAGENFFPKCFLSAHPCHKAVDGITSFAEASCAYGDRENKRSRFPCTVFHTRKTASLVFSAFLRYQPFIYIPSVSCGSLKRRNSPSVCSSPVKLGSVSSVKEIYPCFPKSSGSFVITLPP